MPADAYPLAAVLALRARAEDDARRVVTDASAALTRAEEATATARAAVATHDRHTKETLARERTRDVEPRTVADAQLAHAWAARRKEERRTLAEQVTAAETATRTAHAEVERARVALAAARAERKAIDEHHARWLAEGRKLAETRAEAEVEDLHAGRRR